MSTLDGEPAEQGQFCTITMSTACLANSKKIHQTFNAYRRVGLITKENLSVNEKYRKVSISFYFFFKADRDALIERLGRIFPKEVIEID